MAIEEKDPNTEIKVTEKETTDAVVDNTATEKPLTQSDVVEEMQAESNDVQNNTSGSKPMTNESVVQFTTPAALETVNSLIEEQEPDRKTSKWVLIIVVLVLLILALAAGVVYYFTQFTSVTPSLVSPIPEQSEMAPTPTVTPDPLLQELQQVSESDEVDAIKKDVENTNIDSMGEDLKDIEGSL